MSHFNDLFKNQKPFRTSYPVDAYINNAIRELLEDSEKNEHIISELRFAIIKGGGRFENDVLAKLIIAYPYWYLERYQQI